MHKHDGLSPTHEMYLKIVYQLAQTGDPARVGQMAKGLGVHPSTVSAVVRTLDSMGLVTHDPYGVVKLTDVGHHLAECVVRRFKTLRRFCIEVLGLDEDTAEVEACEMEHAVGALTIRRMESLTNSLANTDFEPPTDESEAPDADRCDECISAGACTMTPPAARQTR